MVGLVGSISEKGSRRADYGTPPSSIARSARSWTHLPLVEASATLGEAFALLSGGANALVTDVCGPPAGVVTKLDLLEYLAAPGTRAASPRRSADHVEAWLLTEQPGKRSSRGPSWTS